MGLDHYKGQTSGLPKSLDDESQDVFVAACKKSGDTSSAEYRRIYWFHWKCFQAADADRDGMVSGDEFNRMINMATRNQQRLGLPTPFSSKEERAAAFKEMDENGDESISFDEWQDFSQKKIFSLIASL